jgi:hypothetical protein
MVAMTRNAGRTALGAVAALLAVSGCSDSGEPAAADPTEDSGCLVLTDDDSDPEQIEGRAGCYSFTARGAGAPPMATLELPEGWSNFGAFAMWPFPGGDAGVPFLAMQYWTVHAVLADPCEGYEEVAVGPSVEDLATALAEQPRTRVTDPVEVTLDGAEGLYLELTAPQKLDFASCSSGYFKLWTSMPADGEHTAESPGVTEHLWILDLEGERAVVATIGATDVAPEDLEELDAIVEKVRWTTR